MQATPNPSTQKRRQHIINSATEIFCEHGYDGASMSAIAAKAGGSKGTLYNYFPSKDELLLAAMLAEAEKFQHDLTHNLDKAQPLKSVLSQIIHRIVNKLYVEPRTAQLLRVVISVGNRSDIGQKFFTIVGDGIWGRIQQLLEEKIASGQLRNTDAKTMLLTLRGLCEVDLMRLLMGAMPNFNKEQAEQRSERILEAFFKQFEA